MNFQNYLEVIEQEKIANKIINLTIFKKGEKIEKKFNTNNSFCRKLWDKTYCKIQKVWAEINELTKNEAIENYQKEQKLKALNEQKDKLMAQERQEFQSGKPYLVNTDFIVGETENSWLIENLLDENQTAIYLSKKWAPDLKNKGIFNYEQIAKMKNNDQKQEFIIFLHPEKSVAIYQNGKYIGNCFLSKMVWFFETISGIWHKFRNYWSKAAIQKRKLEKERILSAKKRLKNAIIANKIALENRKRINTKKLIDNKLEVKKTDSSYYKIKQAYFDELKEECDIVHKDMDE